MSDPVQPLLLHVCPKYTAIFQAYRKGPTVLISTLDRHHIWGGKCRLDLSGNLITLHRCSHDFCHAFPTMGKVACLFAKWKSGELDWQDLDKASGLDAKGWLETRELTGIYSRMRDRIVAI